jgi:hypothetical protein
VAAEEGAGVSGVIDGPAKLPTLSPPLARELLDRSTVEAVEFARPPLDELPYRGFVRAILGVQPFKADFGRMPPQVALAQLSDQLFGAGSFAAERDLLARDIAALAGFAGALSGKPVSATMRTYFAPGDLVWHVDRSHEPDSLRILMPLGRVAGMRVTPADNIDPAIYDPFMRRELPLLCELDRKALRTGEPLQVLWGHRPRQVEAMTLDRNPFLRDPARVWEIERNAISIHRFQTPKHGGTYHRSAWENRVSPGLQIVMTTGGG